MQNDVKTTKVEAIYELREAVEAKVLAERAFDEGPTPEARDALLAAQLDVEAKTQEAIDSCMECGHDHAAGEAHGSGRATGRSDNVIQVDFRP